jgi:hypothetical protein
VEPSSAAWLFLNRTACTGQARHHNQDDHGQCDQARRPPPEPGGLACPARAPANPAWDRRFASPPGTEDAHWRPSWVLGQRQQGLIPGCLAGLDERAGHAVQVRTGRATAPTAEGRHQRSFPRSPPGAASWILDTLPSEVTDTLPSEVKARPRQKCAKLCFAGASLVSATSSRDAVTVGATILGQTTSEEKRRSDNLTRPVSSVGRASPW